MNLAVKAVYQLCNEALDEMIYRAKVCAIVCVKAYSKICPLFEAILLLLTIASMFSNEVLALAFETTEIALKWDE